MRPPSLLTRRLPRGLASRRSLAVAVSLVVVGSVVAVEAGALSQGASYETSRTRATAAARPAGLPPKVDFNNDGYEDLVLAAPHATTEGKKNAGYLAVVYGSARGANPGKRQLLSAEGERIPFPARRDARLGQVTAARDLDADGYTDLAVPAGPRGRLVVLFGSRSGLTAGQATPESLHADGSSLAAGDLNGDGNTDLVTLDSAPSDARSEVAPRPLRVLYGPFNSEGEPRKNSPLAGAPARTASTSGRDPHLLAGDLNGDGKDELLQLAPEGAPRTPTRYWHGTTAGPRPSARRLPAATAATIGDTDRDGYGDLVLRVAAPGRSGDHDGPGALRIVRGSAKGPTRHGRLIQRDSPGMPGRDELGDRFGTALTAGDVDGDGCADLVVGLPAWDEARPKRDEEGVRGGDGATARHRDKGGAHPGRNGAHLGQASTGHGHRQAATGGDGSGGGAPAGGGVLLLRGATKGLSAEGARHFTQEQSAIPGIPERGDLLGAAVTLMDTNGDRKDDLVMGAPGQDGAEKDSGAVWVVPSSPSGLATRRSWSMGPGAIGAPGTGGGLGAALGR
ncbi:FG-GAP-like repeat-containing protein [Streptomyces sp. NPDC005438]|uniref:FG-GAP-like repeat-containing protein n=1 Tax=Streptomyces sp. NPDC005438 TaxID=3156880 RepID=UPI0033A63CC4